MNSDYSDYMKILKEYLAKGNLTPEDKSLFLDTLLQIKTSNKSALLLTQTPKVF